MMPQMDQVIAYMLACSADEEPLLALEACEFWSNFAEAQVAKVSETPVNVSF